MNMLRTSRDVTEQWPERERHPSGRVTEATRLTKSELLAVLNHEIRKPIKGVLRMLDLLLDAELTADQRRLTAIARNSADLAANLIDDLLVFSKTEGSRIELEFASSGLLKTLEEIRRPLCLERVTESIPGGEFPLTANKRRCLTRALVADDNVTDQRIAKLALESLDCHVEVAGSGKECIQKLNQGPYEIVFMDCEMSPMDGFEATAQIRRRGARCALPIVAMTARTRAVDKDLCLAAGMDDYMTKPTGVRDFERMLARWVPGREQSAKGPTRQAPSHTFAGQSASTSGGFPALDRGALDRLKALAHATKPLLFAEILKAFRADAARHIAAFQDAVSRSDLESLRQAAHSLKGASLNTGASAIAALSGQIEAFAVAETVAGVPRLVKELKRQLGLVSSEIDQELSAWSHGPMGADRKAAEPAADDRRSMNSRGPADR